MGKFSVCELSLLWLDSFLGLEYLHKQELYKLIDGKKDIKALIESGREYIENNVGKDKYSLILASANQTYLDYVLESLERKTVTAVTVASDGYPEALKNITCPPLVLYCKGDVSLLKTENKFGIVGSRKSLPLSIRIAENYTEELIDAGFTPVTGIAEGVDKTVIETAVKKKAKAVSVIAGGFDNVYPKSHENLLNVLSENGLVISEQPPEVAPKPYLFPIRNRIIAGLSRGVLIVSGGKPSGTFYTAEYAEEFGRDVFAVPYGIGVSSGVGCNELIKRGAMLTDTPRDITDYYGIKTERREVILSETEKAIVEVLSEGGVHIDKICSALGKKIFEISPVLSMLEIKGIIVKNGINGYGLCRNRSEE